jgi:tripartite-type tricarboxylate transporter receptor subunit TctC
MSLPRLFQLILASVIALCGALNAHAQDAWPTKPIKVIVPFPAGGSSDPPVRVVAAKLQDILGQPVVIENIGGGGGTIATGRLAALPADGYAFGMAAVGTLCIAPHLYSKVAYDPLKSFTPIGELADYANVLVVNANEPYKNIAELIKAAKDNPGKLTYGSAGNGSSNHLSGELLASLTGAKFTHVPYKGTGPAQTDLLGGRLTFMFDVTLNALPHVQSGKLRAIGVTSPGPVKNMPGVPPINQSVPGYEVLGWIGLIAPAGLPQKITDRMAVETEKIMAMPDIVAQYATFGFDPHFIKPDRFAALIKKDYDFWGPVVKASGAKVD